MALRRPSTYPALAVCASLILTALALASQSVALAGDGAYILLRMLESGEVFATDQRFLGSLVRQAPALTGVHAGITDTYVLSLLFGAGLLVVPAIIWSAAVWLARDDRLVFTLASLTAAICAGTTWFFPVSEATIAMPLTALVAVLLARLGPWSPVHAVLAISASAILVASYETVMVTGLVLASWAGVRAAQTKGSLERYSCIVVSALAVASLVVAVRGAWEATYPTHSRSLLYFIVAIEPWPLYLSVTGLMLIIGAAFTSVRLTRLVLLSAGTVGLGVSVVGADVSTYAAFAARGGVGVAVFALLGAAWWRWMYRDSGVVYEPPRGFVAVPVLFAAGILAANVWTLREWSGSLATFESKVNESRGVANADAVIPANRRQVLWGWTASSLSVIVRNSPDAGVLSDTKPHFTPFPPALAHSQIDDAYAWRGRLDDS